MADAYPLGGNGGIMSDVMTSQVEGDRKIKVATDLESDLATLLLKSELTNSKILEQITLLNARFEETFNTGLYEIDND